MYISAHPTTSEPRPSSPVVREYKQGAAVLPLLLPIAALCQPFFQFNDEVERRDLPEQGLWASPKSHGDGVNQRLFEFVEDLPDVSVPCRTQASIAFKACLRLFTGSFRISSSSSCSFSVSGCIQVAMEI